MKRAALVSLFVLALHCPAPGQNGWGVNSVLQVGEELCYKVKWGFFRLGTITIRTFRDSSCVEPTDFKVSMKVESNPDISFVWIQEYNESLMDATLLMSKRFRATHRNGDDLLQISQSYDPARRVATYIQKDLNSGAIVIADTLTGVNPYVEGPSLFAYTRCNARSGKTMDVPTMVNGKIGNTVLDFRLRVEETEIEAVPGPIRVRRYEGTAQWQGGSSAGLSGNFTGWISDDDAAIPVKAELKVLLGSVRLELEKWHRPGWVPPASLKLVRG